jgi:hypothetical protein
MAHPDDCDDELEVEGFDDLILGCSRNKVFSNFYSLPLMFGSNLNG